MKHSIIILTALLLLAVTTAVHADALKTNLSAKVVFEEDFESPEDYQKRWQASSGWSLVGGQIDGRKTKVLDIKGGDEGLSVRGGLADFDYEADVRVVRQGGGFLFRAQDADNLYMLRLVSDNAPWDRSKSPVLTDSFYPHTKKNGKYSADVKQPLTRRVPLREWFHIKFEVRGNSFRIFLGDSRSPDRMELVGQWEGKEPYKDGRFGFRCSGSEHIQVDNIRISTPGPLQPGLVIKPFASPRMITTGQSFDVKVHVQNTGWKPAADMQATLSLPPGLELVQGSPTLSGSTLKIGADRWFSWKVKPTKAVAGRMRIAVTYDGLPVAKTIPVDYVVNPALPVLSPRPAQEAAARVDAQDNVILENQNLRMVFVKNLHGYTAAIVSAYDGNSWRQMAVSQPIGKFSYRANGGSAVETVIIPTQYEILNPSGAVARVRFTSQLVDDDDVTWSFAYTFELEADKSNIKTKYQASANNNRQLLCFQGPDLYAGEGSFGSSKDLAIFPGLEYLEAGEQSSSTRDMANFITFHNNAVGNRYVPHPHKITMPLMGLEQNNGLIGLMWDPLQKWGGDYTRPAARFASPNYIEKQENHLMGLFLPSVPDFVPENDDVASSPYPLTANSQVTLEAYIVAQAPGEVLDMLDQYYAIFGMPEKIDDMSITYEEALEWGRVGYMETIYDPATNGIRLWEQSPAYPAPGAIATLFRLSLDTTDPAKKKVIRDRVDVMVNRALKNEGVRGLTDRLDGRHFPFDTEFPAGCLLRTHMLPFYIGYLEEGIAAWKTRVYEELINTQRQNGTWEYAGDMRKDIRQGDDIVSGTIAELVGGLLKYARITGDKVAFDAGMKGLEVMNSFIVPRGQNTWEVSKYTPDIQAAGLSVWCNLEAYEITGDQKYIEKAKDWAKTGVPFIYHWEQPGLNVMKYSTIAVFGATWYDFIDWLARPVQWCGLPLGYNMIKLAEYDQSFPWKILGEGIMDGAIQQMLFVVNEKPGLYADWIQFVGPYISGGSAWEPEGYMKAIFLSQGQGVEVDTKVLHSGDRRVHVSTGGVLKSAELTKTGRGVSFELEYPAGETSYAVVAGLEPDAKVRKNGRVLARTDDLKAAGEGWKVSADGLLLLKIKHDKLAVRIDVAAMTVIFCCNGVARQSSTIDSVTIKKWSAPYRNWHYQPNYVISKNPNIKDFEGFGGTDVPTVFQLPDDKKWYMTFIGFDGMGYQSFIAESDDLLNWGNMRLAMGFGKKGEFDHGGRVLGAYLYESYDIKAPRILKKKDGKYYSLYGAYPRQGGYELKPGYEGIASSNDGITWQRAQKEPVLSVYQPDCADWEKACIYQPWLIEYQGKYYNHYNAKRSVEQIGLATSSDLFEWKRHKNNPIIPVGGKGSYNERFSADIKIFRDGDHWTGFFFGVGSSYQGGVGTGGAHIMAAFSRDLIHWTVDPEPLYKCGGNPSGLDARYAHKISLVWNPENETYYMFYCAVDKDDNRGVGLITSKPIQ